LIARTAAAWLVAVLLVSPLPLWAQTQVTAGAGAMQIWTDNVFGTEPSPSDGIIDGRGWLMWTPAQRVRLGANGRLLSFQDNPDLNHGYLTMMAETMSGVRGSQARWQAGLANAWRKNADLYEPFDYRDTSAYLSARYYLASAFSTQLRVDGSARAYPDQAVEDARKLWLTVRLQRSLPTRTSLTLALRTGWKNYDDVDQTDAAAHEVSLQAAQSLSSRLALRAWWSASDLYEHGDAAAQMAAFDNPLMDEFSSDGRRLGVALKVIMPWNLVADLSGEYALLDYPGRPPAVYDPLLNTFALNGDQLALAEGERSDEVTRLRLAVQRRSARLWGDSRLDLNASIEWNDQESNDLYWQWSGWSGQVGASVEF
jgi:hypothetical protein